MNASHSQLCAFHLNYFAYFFPYGIQVRFFVLHKGLFWRDIWIATALTLAGLLDTAVYKDTQYQKWIIRRVLQLSFKKQAKIEQIKCIKFVTYFVSEILGG